MSNMTYIPLARNTKVGANADLRFDAGLAPHPKPRGPANSPSTAKSPITPTKSTPYKPLQKNRLQAKPRSQI